MSETDLDVGLFLNTPVFYDEAEGYSADYMNLVDFMLEVGRHVNSLVLFVPVKEGASGAVPFEIDKNTEIVHFPYYQGPFDLLQKSFRIIPRLVQISVSSRLKKLDTVGVVAPSTIGTIVAPLLYLRRKPRFLIMRGDKRQTVAHSFQNMRYKKIFLQTIIRFYDWITRCILNSGQTKLFAFGDLCEELAEYGYNIERVQIMTPLIPADIITEARIGISEPANLLYVGRLAGEKGLYDLIDAVDELRKDGYSVFLHIVGDGPEAEGLQKRVADVSLEERVIFHGFVPRGESLWSKYDEADLFVLPSYTEGFPRVVGEAMARGLPVVTTDVGGIPDLIDNGDNGILVEPGSPSRLSNEIKNILNNKQIYQKISNDSILTAESLTFEQEAQDFIRGLKMYGEN